MSHDPQEIWREVEARLRGFVAKRVAEAAEVDDMLQDVFLRMHRNLGGLKDPRKVVSWLFQITRRAVIDHYRAPTRRREQPAGLASDIERGFPPPSRLAPGGMTDADAARSDLAQCLRPMIDRLPPGYREAVILAELEGLTAKAVAHRLGLSESGTKSRIRRGRGQLKRMLESCCAIQLDRRRSVVGYAPRRPTDNPCGCQNP